jgi:hypothetical protein
VANYVKATNFATKDTLASGNPAKIVKGTEIDTEFNAIASAIASKPDADSPTLTGTPLAPTASTATNNTQIATTAYVVNRIANDTVSALALKANLASPTFTGTPAAPTAALGTNTTQLSTTAFVKAEVDVVKAITITAGTGLTGGGNLSANRTISILSGGVGTTQLADASVTTDKLVNQSVTAAKIANATITGSKIANYTINAVNLNSVGEVGNPPISSARAWVNFNGPGVVGIRAGNNISSISDNGVGDYTVNFYYSMPEANYAVFISSDGTRTNSQLKGGGATYSTSAVQIITTDSSTTSGSDRDFVSVAVFR